MATRIHFTKMHGAGNDYIYVDADRYPIDNPAKAAIAWSNRHTGIGADGLVLIGRSPLPEADFTMRIFNADGSEALMCGNASRCIGKYVYEKGLTPKTDIRLLTRSGIKTLKLKCSETDEAHVESVTVDMGAPALEDARLFNSDLCPSRRGEIKCDGVFVSMGNPHYVIFTEAIDEVETIGSQLERHPAFPERCNIELARVESDGTIRVRVWERGSSITMACGTGACATAVAACTTKRSRPWVTIVMDGGPLNIEWRSTNGHVYLTGPAAFICEGEIDLPQ